MISPEPDAVDDLLIADLGVVPDDVVVIDSPALASTLAERTRVHAWCDDRASFDALATMGVETLSFPLDGNGMVLDVPDTTGVPVLYRLPKSLAELDEVAGATAQAEGWMLAGGRIKHLNRSMNSVIGRHFDAVSASLGVRKARVLRGIGANPHSSEWPKHRFHDDLDLWLAAHGGTFGGTKVDPGTRLLIGSLNRVEGDDLVDLGCGNGILAALLARQGRRVRATDSSWAAAVATTETARLNRFDIDVTWADGLASVPDTSADTIVCNPPFHQDHAKESGPTLAMFADAARALRPGGEFWCVFNSHLPWRAELGRLVGPTTVVAQNPRYTLTRSIN